METGDVVFIDAVTPGRPVDLDSLTLKAVNDGEVKAYRVPRFATIDEVEKALFARSLTLHTRVKARMTVFDEDGKPVVRRVITTPGRLLLGRILPTPRQEIGRASCRERVCQYV